MHADNCRSRASLVLEVLRAFTRLGVTAFGGPIAHLGYFREEFVERRRWLDEHAYADLVSLSQFLPGPASSQVGFSVGLLRAGYLGGLAAWLGFTLPSAFLLVLFASATSYLDGPTGSAVLHSLKLVAVAIVAQAVWTMARSLCADWSRALIAIGAGIAVLLVRSPAVQIAVIVLSGMLGVQMRLAGASGGATAQVTGLVSRRVGFSALVLFALLLVVLPLLHDSGRETGVALFDASYRSGALVFGGGHVVLPLLNEAFVAPGWVSNDAFLAGYGAAQAVPGPLFTFAAYLGAIAQSSGSPIGGAMLGLIGIFLPGILILLGALPFWEVLRQRAEARAAMLAVNAAVVGLLGAALCTPVWTNSVQSVSDAALAIAGFLLLAVWRLPPLLVVALTVAGSVVVASSGLL
ncbi:MAG: chromate efflux transporter [Pseudomonadota bacterium]